MLFDLVILAVAGWLLYVAGKLCYRLVQTLMKLTGVALGAVFLVVVAFLLFPDHMQAWENRLQETPLERLTELADEAGNVLAERLRGLER